MVEREAACRCGDLRVTMGGEPVFVSSCCCTQCQRRTGSFFGVTVYFRPDQMAARQGPTAQFHTDGSTIFHFCPRCGSNIWWVFADEEEDVIGLAGGAFADKTLPSPQRMVWTENRHPFVCTPEGLPSFEGGPD